MQPICKEGSEATAAVLSYEGARGSTHFVTSLSSTIRLTSSTTALDTNTAEFVGEGGRGGEGGSACEEETAKAAVRGARSCAHSLSLRIIVSFL